MQQIADGRHGEWPPGVDVRATFAFAPTDNWNGEIVTKVPFATMWGTCDQVNTGSYFQQSKGKNTVPIYRYTLTGGNHDFYNTQWSPSGGQFGAYDDAIRGTKDGACQAWIPGQSTHPDAEGADRTAAAHDRLDLRHGLLSTAPQGQQGRRPAAGRQGQPLRRGEGRLQSVRRSARALRYRCWGRLVARRAASRYAARAAAWDPPSPTDGRVRNADGGRRRGDHPAAPSPSAGPRPSRRRRRGSKPPPDCRARSSNAAYSAAICGQSVSLADGTSSCTAAIAACS